MPLFDVEFSDNARRGHGLYFDQSESQLRLGLGIWKQEPHSIAQCSPSPSATSYLFPGRAGNTVSSRFLNHLVPKKCSWGTLAVVVECLYGAAEESGLDIEALKDVTKAGILRSEARGYVNRIIDILEAGGEVRQIAGLFPERVAPIIDAALEQSQRNGTLPQTFLYLTEYCTTRADRKNTVFYWPMILASVIAISFVITFFMQISIGPQFRKIFEDMGASLPAATQLVLYGPFSSMQPLIILVLIGLVCSLTLIEVQRFSFVPTKAQDLFLSLPILGRVRKYEITAQSSGFLSLLTNLGVPEKEALLIISKAWESDGVERALFGAFTLRCSGTGMKEALAAGIYYSSTLSWLYDIKQDRDWSRYFGERQRVRISSVNAMLSVWIPLLSVLIVGCIVGAYVLALFMPIMNLSSIVGN